MKLSNSKLNQYRMCPRSFFYKHICNIEPIDEGETEHDRSFGKAIHCGIEELYKTGDINTAIYHFKEAYPQQLNLEDEAKTQENGITLLRAYWNTYQVQMKDWKVIAIEVLDEYEPIEGIIFRVKLDLVAENVKYGGIYGFDWKTTGKSLNYQYWGQFNPNAQISTYFDYITSKFGQCAGFYIDAMSFGHRKRAYKGEPAGFHYKLERQLFSQTKDQLADWRDSEREWHSMLMVSHQTNKFPMNTHSCRFCSYRPICSAGWNWESDRDLILCQYTERSTNEQPKGESDAISPGLPSE